MFKKMILRATLGHQLKDLPKEMREQFMAMVEKNPAFFEKIGKEIEARTKGGQDKMLATQAVMMQYRGEIQKMLQGK